MGQELDRLNEQKNRFLERHPDGAEWTEAEPQGGGEGLAKLCYAAFSSIYNSG